MAYRIQLATHVDEGKSQNPSTDSSPHEKRPFSRFPPDGESPPSQVPFLSFPFLSSSPAPHHRT